MQITEESPYMWDLQINVQMSGAIKRLSSRNHSIHYETNKENEARIYLHSHEKQKIHNDFILYIRDDKINETTAIVNSDLKTGE